MRRIFLFVVFIILLSFGSSFIKENVNIDEVKERSKALIENGELKEVVIGFLDTAKLFFNELEDQSEAPIKAKKPELLTPTEHTFSIYNLTLGANKDEVEEKIGDAQRVSINEYGENWHTYHENYQNFVQIMYNENNEVIGLYTNQDLISSTNGIQLGITKDEVREQLGDPMTKMIKGLVIYEFQGDRDYDIFPIDNSYITIFYDIHKKNTVTAIQIISESLEKEKKGFYTTASEQLREGFELQMFDLTNATRVQHGLLPLQWDEKVRGTARKHSADMAEHNYFNHTNLKGESPFDRMLADQITFTVAGENLAYGQFSSIFAHEGLMNSIGHRENILKADFDYLGVGVAFNDESHPYYTQKYFSK